MQVLYSQISKIVTSSKKLVKIIGIFELFEFDVLAHSGSSQMKWYVHILLLVLAQTLMNSKAGVKQNEKKVNEQNFNRILKLYNIKVYPLQL